jgi:hypothetical protein
VSRLNSQPGGFINGYLRESENCIIRNCQNGLGGLLQSGNVMDSVSSDAFSNARCVLNSSVSNVDRTGTNFQPDIFQFSGDPPNNILCKIVATAGIDSQGLFAGQMQTVENSVIDQSNISIGSGIWKAISLSGRVRNLIIRDSNIAPGQWRIDPTDGYENYASAGSTGIAILVDGVTRVSSSGVSQSALFFDDVSGWIAAGAPTGVYQSGSGVRYQFTLGDQSEYSPSSGGTAPPGSTEDIFLPVVVWATPQGSMPTGSTGSVGIAGIDNFGGLSSVDFIFTTPVFAGGTSSTRHTVTFPTWRDLHAIGLSADYWALDFNRQGTTSVSVSTVINRFDGVTYSMPIISPLRNRSHFRQFDFGNTGSVIYVSNEGDDDNSGFSPVDAKETLDAAIVAAGNTHDTVILAPGEYDVELIGAIRTKPLNIVGGGAGNTTLRYSGSDSLSIGGMLSFRDIGFSATGNGLISENTGTLSFRNCIFNLGQPTQGMNRQSKFLGVNNLSFFGCGFSGGDHALFFGMTGNAVTEEVIVAGCNFFNTGSAIRGSGVGLLVERNTVNHCGLQGEEINYAFIDGTGSSAGGELFRRSLFRYNTIFDCGTSGASGNGYPFMVALQQSKDIAAYNNLYSSFVGTNGDTICIGNDDSWTGEWKNYQITNNLFLSLDNPQAGIKTFGDGDGLIFKRNVINRIDFTVEGSENVFCTFNLITDNTNGIDLDAFPNKLVEDTPATGYPVIKIPGLAQGNFKPDRTSPLLNP